MPTSPQTINIYLKVEFMGSSILNALHDARDLSDRIKIPVVIRINDKQYLITGSTDINTIVRDYDKT